MDGGRSVDASGEVVTPGGVRIPFRNAVDLMKALAEACFVGTRAADAIDFDVYYLDSFAP